MRNINFHSCTKIDNKIWFMSVEGYLMNFDSISYQSQIVAPHNLSELYFKQVVDNMIPFNHQIYFVEQDGSKLYEYNIDTNYCNYYKIPKAELVNWGCFSGVYLFDQVIYLFPRSTGIIYCFDIISKKFAQISNDKEYHVMNSFRVQNRVYLYGEQIICFDMCNNSIVEVYCFEEDSIFWMDQYQNTFFSLKDNRISIWDCYDNSESVLYKKEGLVDEFQSFVPTKNKIFLLPGHSENILILDRKSGCLSTVSYPDDLYYIEKGWAKYYGYMKDGKYIWCANRVSNYLLCIDKEMEYIKWIKLKSPNLKEEVPYLRLLDKSFFSESEISIEQFLYIDPKKTYYAGSIYGKKIWKNMV